MTFIDSLKNVFRKPVAKPRLVSARTTDSAPRTVSVRHWGGQLGKFYTRDAVPTRDVILGTEPPSYERLSNGATWTGGLRPEMSGLRVRPELLGAEPEWGERFNAESRRFWAEGNTEPTADTAAHTVDRIAAAAHARAASTATNVHDQGAAINAANKSFWGSAA